jgi:hypothetical protein
MNNALVFLARIRREVNMLLLVFDIGKQFLLLKLAHPWAQAFQTGSLMARRRASP